MPYILVFLSGMAALLYEVVWQRYLSILLGAQARATSLVLAVFLGGMSLGYYYYGVLSKKKSLAAFRLFSVVELGLAAWALCFSFLFHFFFNHLADLQTYFTFSPFLLDLCLAIILMGFPTVLMGASLPILTQGLSQTLNRSSRVHSRLYGYNSLGAALGAFITGFVLIPLTNFQIALVCGAAINVFVALVSFLLYAKKKLPMQEVRLAEPKELSVLNARQILILCVGFLSGAYVIAFETTVIRFISLSTGASNYIFSLVVSLFILSLGLGGLLGKRIKRYKESRLFWNQILLATSLCLLYATIYYWPYWVHLIRVQYRELSTSFYFYQTSLALFFFVLLFIPTSLAGLVLPLCFHLIKDDQKNIGFRVGQLYSLNTIGCIFGAVFGGYFILNYFELDQVWRGIIFLVLVSSLVAYRVYTSCYRPSKLKLLTQGVGLLLPLLICLNLKPVDRTAFLQAFRTQDVLEESFLGAQEFYSKITRHTRILSWKDGPNSSVGIGASPFEGQELSRSIFVNGKSDGNTRGDYFTTVLLGGIPALLQKHPESTCVIGFGTGITIGTLNVFKEVKNIDVVEISGTVIDKAPLFESYNGHVLKSTKVRIHEVDAFRFLEKPKKYDLIISEPSNPWVIGIENLYSKEFYAMARRSLAKEGYLVQWIHTYSFNDELFKMVLHTMSTSFPNISVFQLKGGDLALVGGETAIGLDNLNMAEIRLQEAAAGMLLKSAGISSPSSLAALELMPPAVTKILAEEGELHTLESPKLSQRASKAFFLETQANPTAMKRTDPSLLEHSLLTQYWNQSKSKKGDLVELVKAFCTEQPSKNTRLCEETQLASEIQNGITLSLSTEYSKVEQRELAAVRNIHTRKQIRTLPDLMKEYELFDSYRKYISPISYLPASEFVSPLDQCLKNTKEHTELWGECLLQKLIVIDTLKSNTAVFKAEAYRFLDWANEVPQNSRIYEKVTQAKQILLRLLK